MIGPMLLGYAVGAVGVYALLYRFAPVKADGGALPARGTAEIITLFEDDASRRRAA